MSRLSRVLSEAQARNILEEFRRVQGKCYLDNAGASMYPKSQMEAINEDLLNNVYMNPHTDQFTADCIDQIRYKVLKHFNTDQNIYTVIFTSGSTQAFKLVAESFEFNKNSYKTIDKEGALIYIEDNHTSVLGMREIAIEKKAEIIRIGHRDFLETNVNEIITEDEFEIADGNALFVYSAQNNFNGFKYPLDFSTAEKCKILNKHTFKSVGKMYKKWYVFLDTACYVSTNKMDLSLHQPDFMCMSFYKIFGFPTGLGAVLVKNSSAAILNQKSYFGGGTVDVVLSGENYHVKRKKIHERFEDGTASFLSILSLKHCFDTLYRIIPKIIHNDIMETISHHTFYLAKDLYQQLNILKHSNGQKAVVLYGDSEYDDVKKQGSIVAFNLVRSDGQYIGYSEVHHMANLFNIYLRTGCFCNTGSCQRHLKLTRDEIIDMFAAGHNCGDGHDLHLGKPTGCIRVSFGYYNTLKDVDELMAMICKCFVQTTIVKPCRDLIFDNENMVQNNNTIIANGHEVIYNKQNIEISNVVNGFANSDDTNFKDELKKNTPQPYIEEAPIAIFDEIAIFPIKSCGAYKINTSWNIGPKGFDFDREWMIVRDNGVCLTQKQCTRMCMIRPSFNFIKRVLILSFPGKPSMTIPLDGKPNRNNVNASFCHSKVCNDNIEGYDCGEEVGDWISEALEISFLRLIRQSDDSQRKVKKSKSENNFLSLSNQAQFLMINKATVRWLADKITDSTFNKNITGLVDRFRGNIIVDTEDEFVETKWTKVVIGKHEFKVEGPCNRCQMVCIDQKTGEKTVEPLRTISNEFAGKIQFGIYLSYTGTVDESKEKMLRCNLPIDATLQPVYTITDKMKTEKIKSINQQKNYNADDRNDERYENNVEPIFINDKIINTELVYECGQYNNVTTQTKLGLIVNGFKDVIINNFDALLSKREVTVTEEESHAKNGFGTIIEESNLCDNVPVLSEIAIFPIKSCGPYKINTSWKIGVKGFEFDREWMIVRDNGICLTQKQCPRMCMIRPSFNFDKRQLILNFPGKPTKTVPLDMNPIKDGVKTSYCHSKVCNDNIDGIDCGEDVGDWISEALDISFLRLLKHCEDRQRLLKKSKSQGYNETKMLSLSNQAQFLLINKATVRWLADKIEDVTFDKDLASLIDRFRGNIIVDTEEELVETEWTEIAIGKHKFKVDGPCNRCQMVCIDQKNGEKTVEPLRTISKEFSGKMRFGIYLSYIGTADGSKDMVLRCNLPIDADCESSDISR